MELPQTVMIRETHTHACKKGLFYLHPPPSSIQQQKLITKSPQTKTVRNKKPHPNFTSV